MSDKTPRFYQEVAIEKVARDKEKQHAKNMPTKGLILWATGLGKSYFSVLQTHRNYPLATNRTFFIAPARILVNQYARNAVRDVPEYGKDYTWGMQDRPGIGTVMGSINHADARTIVGSMQTLIPRNEDEDLAHTLRQPIEHGDFTVDRFGGIRCTSKSRKYLISKRMDELLQYGMPNSIWFDEAHHSIAQQTMEMIWRLNDLQALLDCAPVDIGGLTATARRADKNSLLNLYNVVYDMRTTFWAQEQGYLAPFADPPIIRVSIDSRSGEGDMKGVANWDEQIYQALQDKAPNRQILIFMDSMPGYSRVEASEYLARYLSEQGIPTAHTDGMKTIDEDGTRLSVNARQIIYDKFMAKKIRVICAYGVGLEGLDLPIADCVLLLRRSQEPHILIQAIGRVLRPHPGKTDALILDGVVRNIDISPVESLLGLKVQREPTRKELEDGDEEEKLLSMAMRDPHATIEIATGNIYTPAQIKAKSSARWYIDPDTGRWFMSLNFTGDTFCIEPPNDARALSVRNQLDVIQLKLNGEENPYSELNPELYQLYKKLSNFDDDTLHEMLEEGGSVETYYANYTLWWIHDKGKLKHPWWIEANEDILSLIMASNQHIDRVPNTSTAMLNKRLQSFQEPVSGPQKHFLRGLGLEGKIHEEMTKAEAGGVISAHKINPIMNATRAHFESIRLVE